MKYILMMSATKADCEAFMSWPQEDLQKAVVHMRSFSSVLKEAGVYVDTLGLSFPHEAKLVRTGDGGVPVTDGVFPESKEFLMGFWVIDVESPEQAYAFAAQLSDGPGTEGMSGKMPIEVRQIMESAPKEWEP